MGLLRGEVHNFYFIEFSHYEICAAHMQYCSDTFSWRPMIMLHVLYSWLEALVMWWRWRSTEQPTYVHISARWINTFEYRLMLTGSSLRRQQFKLRLFCKEYSDWPNATFYSCYVSNDRVSCKYVATVEKQNSRTQRDTEIGVFCVFSVFSVVFGDSSIVLCSIHHCMIFRSFHKRSCTSNEVGLLLLNKRFLREH